MVTVLDRNYAVPLGNETNTNSTYTQSADRRAECRL